MKQLNSIALERYLINDKYLYNDWYMYAIAYIILKKNNLCTKLQLKKRFVSIMT